MPLRAMLKYLCISRTKQFEWLELLWLISNHHVVGPAVVVQSLRHWFSVSKVCQTFASVANAYCVLTVGISKQL